ncbi:MAG: LuxR C-terminal-related transcriptional regulator [Planctomycetota bacterium]
MMRRTVMRGIGERFGATCWRWSVIAPGRNPSDPFTTIGELHEAPSKYRNAVNAERHRRWWPDRRTLHPMLTGAQPIVEAFGGSTLSQGLGALSTGHVSPGPVLMFVRPGPAAASVVSFHRDAGDQAFDDDEARVARTILGQLDWLHHSTFSSEDAHTLEELSLRLRDVLEQLLDGQNKKEIAEDLNLSPHTVGDYIKDIYRRFRVNSQVKLMAKFTKGLVNIRD